MNLNDILKEAFPIKNTYYSLLAVDDNEHGSLSFIDSESNLKIVMQLIQWEFDGTDRKITSIYEQELLLAYSRHTRDSRLEAYVGGWVIALEEVFIHIEKKGQEGLLGILPHDLVYPKVLDLKKPLSDNDFVDAFLNSKKRLGRFLKI